jgi:hypothetical protein
MIMAAAPDCDVVNLRRCKMVRRKNRERQNASTSISARSAFVRRHYEISQALLADQGGRDHCSESLKQLIKRLATVSVLAEQLETQLSCGQGIDVAEYSQILKVLVRIAQAVGIDRKKSDSEPRLVDLLRSQDKE